jgi:hypothetical protein
MIIKLDKYKNIQPTVQSMIKNNYNRDHVDLVANIAVACNCPVIVCCFYYIKNLGYAPEESVQQIKNLIKFYKYSRIDGIKELGIDNLLPELEMA